MEERSSDVVQRCTASGTPEEAVAKVSEYIAKGCTTPILYPLGRDARLMIDTFADWSRQPPARCENDQ